jgi:hypothetical protein
VKVRSEAIRKSARGQDCALRIPGHCNFDTETTVLAHVGKNIGMSMKCDDTMAVYASAVTVRGVTTQSMVELTVLDAGTQASYILDALEETQNHLI